MSFLKCALTCQLGRVFLSHKITHHVPAIICSINQCPTIVKCNIIQFFISFPVPQC